MRLPLLSIKIRLLSVYFVLFSFFFVREIPYHHVVRCFQYIFNILSRLFRNTTIYFEMYLVILCWQNTNKRNQLKYLWSTSTIGCYAFFLQRDESIFLVLMNYNSLVRIAGSSVGVQLLFAILFTFLFVDCSDFVVFNNENFKQLWLKFVRA